jgi:hypothetical protein
MINFERVQHFIVRYGHLCVYSLWRFLFDNLNQKYEVLYQILSYWSSTTNANNSDNAWNVNFSSGNTNNNNKNNDNYVRCVRSGE